MSYTAHNAATGIELQPGDVLLSKHSSQPWKFERVHTDPKDESGNGAMLSLRDKDGRKMTVSAASFNVTWRYAEDEEERAAVERIEANELLAELARDRTVTIEETAAVIEWVRDWAKDCQWADIAEDLDIDALAVARLLRSCDRHIDGGLRFVLDDVRRVANESARCPKCGMAEHAPDKFCNTITGDDVRTHPVFAGFSEKTRETIARNVDAATKLREVVARGVESHGAVLAITEGGTEGYGIVREHSGTEDGSLWYVTFDGCHVEPNAGWLNREDAIREAQELAKVAGLPTHYREAVEEMRSTCPAASDYALAIFDGRKLVSYRQTSGRDRNAEAEYEGAKARLLATVYDDFTGLDVTVVDVAGDVFEDVNELAKFVADPIDVPTRYELVQSTDALYEIQAGPYSADAREAHERQTVRLLDMLAQLDEDDTRDMPERTFAAVGLHFDDVEREQSWSFGATVAVHVARTNAAPGSIEARCSHTITVEGKHRGLGRKPADAAMATHDEAPGWIIAPGHVCRAIYGRDVTGRWTCWMS